MICCRKEQPRKGGGDSGGENIPCELSPKPFWTPTYDTFSPPFAHAFHLFPSEDLSAPDQSHFLRPSKVRAALKGTNLRGQTQICGFLRGPAVFCGFMRKSAVFCENLRFPNALFSKKRRESAKISENQRKTAFGLGLSP